MYTGTTSAVLQSVATTHVSRDTLYINAYNDVCDMLSIDVYSLSVFQCFSDQL